MGSNYVTETSDVLTDTFDVAIKKLIEKHPEQKELIELVGEECRGLADATYRKCYSLLKSLEDIL